MEFEAKYYQKYCIDKVVKCPELGLILDMGMGKTAITLSGIEELM